MPADGGTPRQVSKRTGVIGHRMASRTARSSTSSPPTADRRRARAPAAARRHSSCSTKRGRRHLWKMAVADGAETRVTSGADYVFAYRIAAERRAHHHQPPPDPAAGRHRQDGAVEHRRRRHRSDPADEEHGAGRGRRARAGRIAGAVSRASEPSPRAVLQRECLSRACNGRRGSRADAGLPVRSAARGLGGRQQIDLDGREHRRAQRSVPGRSRVAETAADHQRRSCAGADRLEHRRRTSRVHDRRADAHRRHLDVGARRRRRRGA